MARLHFKYLMVSLTGAVVVNAVVFNAVLLDCGCVAVAVCLNDVNDDVVTAVVVVGSNILVHIGLAVEMASSDNFLSVVVAIIARAVAATVIIFGVVDATAIRNGVAAGVLC